MWKNIVQTGRQQLTIWRMRTACWVPKATNTDFQKMLILIAFSIQQLLQERALLLRIYAHCLSCLIFEVLHDCAKYMNQVFYC